MSDAHAVTLTSGGDELRAACVRCGTLREGLRATCPQCGLRPEGEGVLVAWLLSAGHLSDAQLTAAAARVAGGEVLRPSHAMLAVARRALGVDFTSDPGLTPGQRALVLGASVVLTPLVGGTLWAWWRRQRPRAALQALLLSAPVSLITLVVVAVLALR